MLPRAPCYEPEPRPEPLCHQPRCLSTASMQRPVQAIVLTFELLHIRGSSRNSLCSNKKTQNKCAVLGGTRRYSVVLGGIRRGTRRYSAVLSGTRRYSVVLEAVSNGIPYEVMLVFRNNRHDHNSLCFCYIRLQPTPLYSAMLVTVLIRTTRCGAETLSHVVSRRFAKD